MKNYYSFGRRFTLLSFLLLICFGSSYAQVNTYAFSQSTGTYSAITGGTVLGTASNDDQNYTNLPIGFTFVYNGNAYTAFSVNNNGFLAMGTTVTSSYVSISGGTTNNVVAGFNRDLQGNTSTSELSYLTQGTAPNRTLTVQWKNYKKFGTNGTGDDYNFKIVLYETSNIIEVHYGTITNNANTATPQVGLRGAANTDYNNRTTTTDWSATTAGGANTATCTVTSAIFPASGTIFRWTGPPATPPTPVQAAGTPTCSGGTNLTLTGTPATGVTWYWQTTATGTSTATPYSGPYTVFANGTYYARAYDSGTSLWSTFSSSITVSNFPQATPPPAATAAQNPSCAPAGTNLTVAAAPAGYVYYWQGTTAGGTSNALNASSPYNATATGTYYVAAFETATGCWSSTVGTSITVSTLIPNVPTVTQNVLNICAGATSAPIAANGTSITAGSLTTTQAGGNGCTNGNMFDVTAAAGSAVTFTSMNVTPNATSTQNVTIYYKVGTYVGSEANAAAWTLLGTYSITGTAATAINVDHADFTVPAGATYGIYVNYNAQYTNSTTTFSNSALTISTGAGFCTAFSGAIAGRTFNGTLFYTTGSAATVSWFNAATGGTNIGSGSPFETVGSSVMPTATLGSYQFYPASYLNGCYSATGPAITVNVANVNAALNPVNATCNGGNNGSFTLGTVECGTQPFVYSVNGGAFGAIPTNLTAGTYSIVIRDANMLTSSPISVVVGQPTAPQNLTVVDANYFNAVVTWTPQGNETGWIVEYGPDGFTPGTGTIINATNDTITIPGLTAATQYDFYVTAVCGTNSAPAGPANMNTNSGFYTYDTNCGPGFTDIAATGTNNVLTDDAEVGVTLPFPFMYQGTVYNDITIGNNGGIVFGTQTAQIGFGNGAIGTAVSPGLYPFWDDIGTNGSGVYYQTLGAPGAQQFIVQWNKEHLSTAGNELIFQLVLDQATNEVYFFYNDVIVGNAGIDYGASATIGAAGVTNVQVSSNSATFLQNNSCVHFYSALCPNPTNLTVQPFQEEAIIDWVTGLYGETNWTIIYGPTGFDPATGGTTVTSTNSDANIFGLTQNTTYDVYVYSECAADNLTSGGVMLTFTTLPFCTAPSNITTSTNVDQFGAAWNWTENPGYSIDHFNLQYAMTGFDLYAPGAITYEGGTNNMDTVNNVDLMGGGVYQVYVQAVCQTGDTSSYVGPITFLMPLTNDFTCDAEMLAVDGTAYTFNNTGASGTEGVIAPPATGAQTTTGWTNSTLNNSTWFTFVAPASGQVRVNNTAINYNGQVAVYEVGDCLDYATFTLQAANDNEIGGTSLAPNFTICGLTPGATYYLMHDGFNGTTGNYSISITPIVLEAGAAQPLTQICIGSSVDLFTTVSGNNAGGVWSSAIGAVNANISGSNFTSEGLNTQVFQFQYRVTDGCAYDSIMTQVQVFPPSHAGEDGSLTVCRNEPVDLLAGLDGLVDMGGTWYNPQNAAMPASLINASNIPGQFNYDYIVSNGVCSADTSNVLLTVLNSCDYLSIVEETFGGVSIYPNPSKGMIYVANEFQSEAFDYSVTDANGRVLKAAQKAISGSATSTIDLSGAQTGIYFIRLSNAQAEKVFRVVIN